MNLNLWNSAEAWESAKKQLVEEFSYLNDSKKKKTRNSLIKLIYFMILLTEVARSPQSDMPHFVKTKAQILNFNSNLMPNSGLDGKKMRA